MNARLLKFSLFLLLHLCIVFQLFAQERLRIDSISILYADTTGKASPYFLVRFKDFPGNEVLSRHGLVRSLSREHHILQDIRFDTSETKKVLTINKANYNWKCSDPLIKELSNTSLKDSIRVQVSYTQDIRQLRYCRPFSIATDYPVALAVVQKKDWALFTAQEQLRFADRLRTPHTEVVINNALPSIDFINALQQKYPALQGEQQVVGIKEELFDTTDIDLSGKSVPSPLAASTLNPHATMMATLIAGAGNTGLRGKGVAVKARLSSSDYLRLLPDPNDYFKNAGISLQNHSYGTTIENQYATEAVAYDAQVFTLDTLLHVFSSGNIGNTAPQEGLYKGITGYANLSGTFKQSKNVLIAGGVDTNYFVPVLSSKGPAFDGRIAPQIVAFGQAGTSDAAATTTGIATLTQEAYQQTYGVRPSAAMLKAILINSADDTGTPGPDYSSGFGILNALAAVQTVKDKSVFNGVVAANNNASFPLTIPANTARLKATLVWNDPSASELAVKALLNDLDFSFVSETGKQHLPWVLSTYPHVDSLKKPAYQGRDTLNNIEQITIDFPTAGKGQLVVRANQLRSGNSQRFSLAYQFVPVSSFEWQYPAAGEQLSSGNNISVRWRTLHTGNGTLAFSIDSGATWTTIAANIPLSAGNTRWNIPAVFSQGLLRITTADTSWISSPFNISSPIAINIGFNCPDSLLVYWQGVKNAAAYDVQTMTGQTLSRLTLTDKTTLSIPKSQLPTPYITIRPVHKDGWTGLQSSTYNYDQQGVSCFFRQVLADVMEDNSIDISVVLSSLLRIKKVSWERLQGNDFIMLSSQDIATEDTYIFKDIPGRSGIFYYRVKLELTDGRVIYSDIQSVQLLINQDFHLFPVPAGQALTLISKRLGDFRIRITDMNGRTLFAAPLTSVRQTYSLKGIAPGVYLCVIYEGAQKIFVKRFIKAGD
ncbi:S8 family peptidase [Chitinophaga pinensis]|uniref:S8 family serine peptidase n=1 Tax=Chitinophaga pinensis TaxID=79329 RepID=A0A5C6LQY8_9BACT|nr:S8 family peptidase [Chitinophaga pinensis]TWV99740.1 S8 family serine peptidase [Chitinophaga pinensis]